MEIDKLELFVKNIIKKVEKYYTKYKITIIPFYDYKKFDVEQSLYLKQKISSDKIYVECYPEKIDDLIRMFNKMNLIISMRYHGSLVGTILNKPVISILNINHPHYLNKMYYVKEAYDKKQMVLEFDEFFDKHINIKKIVKINLIKEMLRKLKYRIIINNSERQIRSILKNKMD